jgi:hypothetical protein
MAKRAPVLKRPLLTLESAAAYMGFTPRQLRRWIEQRTLTIDVVKVFGRNYFDPEDLDRFIESLPRQIPADMEAVLVTELRPKRKTKRTSGTRPRRRES